jgi:thermostable 8-oxoguanine DNA glycosylase
LPILITPQSIEYFKNLHAKHQNHPLVLERIENSSSDKKKQDIDINLFWSALVEIINATQDRSAGLNSPTNDTDYKIKKWDSIKDISHDELRELAYTEFMDSNIDKYSNNNARYAVSNRNFIKKQGEEKILKKINSCEVGNATSEEKTCVFLQKLKGIGPKQSRSILQYLGLSHHQVPIDSAVLNQLEISGIDITDAKLDKERDYQEVQNIIWNISKELNVLPCVFDAIGYTDRAD